ncbi:MAG: Ca2+-dependent phosphoinositide-specific phospholipase C [Hymenobacter sp.]
MNLLPPALLGAALLAAFTKPAEPLLNQIQVIGSHNSYKQAIDPKLFALLQKADSASMSKIDYEHATLTEQLDRGLLAAWEIDVYADAQGGKYAHPKGLDLAPGQPPYDAAGLMREPGFKIFHVQDLDFRSNAPTFRLALQELKNGRWRTPRTTRFSSP